MRVLNVHLKAIAPQHFLISAAAAAARLLNTRTLSALKNLTDGGGGSWPDGRTGWIVSRRRLRTCALLLMARRTLELQLQCT